MDFYFNGHWLSEFGGMICGKSGFNNISILPQLEIKTEKVLGRHGEIVYDSTYQPRSFVVPVKFEDISIIRDIAGWLNATEPQDFYFKGDAIKIQCLIDSALDLEMYCYQGVVDLKFIAHNPLYTSIEDFKYVITKYDRSYAFVNPLETFNTVTITQYDRYTPATIEIVDTNEQTVSQDLNSIVYTDGIVTKTDGVMNIEATDMSHIEIFNDGNMESYPLIKVVGFGDITVTIGDKSFTLQGLTDYAYIDMFYCTVYKDTSPEYTNLMDNLLDDFITLPCGNVVISVVGTCTALEIQCRSQWI
jgi:predicted phage tail component-like protein